MKALTLWQPYAQAIALGLKKYETRSWATKYRGKIAIHSSIKPLSKEYKKLADKYGIKDLAFGKIIVYADLVDCILMTDKFINQQCVTEKDFGDWRMGRYAWKLENIEVILSPLPVRGRQGLWNFVK